VAPKERRVTMQCLDHPIESALELVKFGKNWRLYKGRRCQIVTPDKLDLSFLLLLRDTVKLQQVEDS